MCLQNKTDTIKLANFLQNVQKIGKSGQYVAKNQSEFLDDSHRRDSIQWGAEQTDYLPIYEANRGYFKWAKPTLKMLLASWTFDTVYKGFRSFNAKNLGSVDQRTAKLPVTKLWEWFNHGQTQIQADWFECGRGCAADFSLRPPALTASNFEAL